MNLKIGGVLIIAFLVLVSGCVQIPPEPKPGHTGVPDESLKKFTSYENLSAFLKDRTISQGYGGYGILEDVMKATDTAAAPSAETSGGATPEFSTTNIQVEGVDEADIIKTDGNYIYVVSGNKLVIVKSFPAHEAKILSTLELNGTVYELFINKDRLVVFTVEDSYEYIIPEGVEIVPGTDLSIFPRTYETLTHVKVFDVSDRTSPTLVKDEKLSGNYFNSRMIGDYVYVLSTDWIYSYYGAEEDIDVPGYAKCIGGSGNSKCGEDFPDIYYIDVPSYSYMFTTVAAVNTQTDEELSKKVFLLPSTDDMFVSQNNIYITYLKYDYEDTVERVGSDVSGFFLPTTRTIEKTAIHRIAIDGKEITLEASGEVQGRHLDQFSMDEFNGYFRIATTTGDLWDKTSKNHLYVLDKDLKTVGKLEDLAPGEAIYSARFMGNRAYLVTFKKVDPLFVIDLTEPTNPTILGKLKIPGFSDYLHPYDENHIIGIGKEAVEAEEGDFAWYQGVKLALFDVTDPSKPKDISKVEIGDRGTDSLALVDHRAFLFDKEKKLLVIPILVAEIDEEQYPEGVTGSTYGDYTFQGAYVYSLDLENGFQFNGGITHVEDQTDLLKSGYYYSSPFDVKRSLYIDNTLYTLSDKAILASDLRDLSQIKRVDLPYEEPDYYYGPIIE